MTWMAPRGRFQNPDLLPPHPPSSHVAGAAIRARRWGPALFDRFEAASDAGCAVTFGPHEPARDASFRALSTPFSWDTLRTRAGSVPLFVDDAPASADTAVARAIDTLGLPTFACDPEGVVATVHEDAAGRPRVLFVINPTESDLVARVSILTSDVRAAHDLLDGEHIRVQQGAIEVRVSPRTTRMLCLE